jgi:hypothetical protein
MFDVGDLRRAYTRGVGNLPTTLILKGAESFKETGKQSESLTDLLYGLGALEGGALSLPGEVEAIEESAKEVDPDYLDDSELKEFMRIDMKYRRSLSDIRSGCQAYKRLISRILKTQKYTSKDEKTIALLTQGNIIQTISGQSTGRVMNTL